MRLEPSRRVATPVAPAPVASRPAANTSAKILRLPAPAPVQNDKLLRFEELSVAQRHLFGANGAQTYAKLSSEDRAVFLLLTTRMDRAGMDYSGLTLKDPLETIRRNRLLFNHDAQGVAKLRASIDKGLAGGSLYEDKPFGPFHAGMSDWGVRESRFKWTMQLGGGKDGVFVDVDRYNYKAGWKGWLGHASELLVPGKPNPLDIARELGEDFNTRIRRAA